MKQKSNPQGTPQFMPVRAGALRQAPREMVCIFILLAGYLLASAFCFLTIRNVARLPDTDMAMINRLAKEAALGWEEKSFDKKEGTLYPFGVISEDGTLLYRSDTHIPDTLHEAYQKHMTVLDVERDGHILGKILIDTGYDQGIQIAVRRWTQASVVLLSLPVLFLCLYQWYLNRTILGPFDRLQGFAKHVAMGNLDMPLPMDRRHSFGAFTESFDLMRDQIREAKKREEQESRSKRELTASLSHDIKTPVTSIKLVSELLLATEPEGTTKNKIRTIYQKADQIDHLVSNLLQSSLEDLGELTVSVSDESSKMVEEWIAQSDCYGIIHCGTVPGCILRADRQRLCQVLDNILYNSYKYAGTPITVDFILGERELSVMIKDTGKGVPHEELPLLFQKYYRGSNSRDNQAEGSGLGLYIASYLMEKMGGGIQCYNWEHGFCTELIILLALPENH